MPVELAAAVRAGVPSTAVTVYPVMGAPPFETGAVQDTVAWV